MTKPPKTLPPVNWKAPKANRPKAPLQTIPETARQVPKSDRRGPRGNPDPADRSPLTPQLHTGSGPRPTDAPLGARIARRAAERLRSGHLWVYASDIESIE